MKESSKRKLEKFYRWDKEKTRGKPYLPKGKVGIVQNLLRDVHWNTEKGCDTL